MAHVRPGLLVLLTIGLTGAVISCGSSASTTRPVSPAPRSPSASPAAASSPSFTPTAAAIPSGYRRVGGAVQGISIAIPASWVVIDLTNSAIDTAVRRAGFRGAMAATLIQDAQIVQEQHGLFVVDVKSARHFPSSISALCLDSTVTETGSAGLPFLRRTTMSQLRQEHAGHIRQRDVLAGGVPGIETSYTLYTSVTGTVDAAQIIVLPHPGQGCAITVGAAAGQFPDDVLAVAASTAQFPNRPPVTLQPPSGVVE